MPLEHANRYRSHTCGELRASDEKCSVNLSGWVARRRDMGGVIFIDLRDREGITQVVFDPQRSGAELHRQADRLRSEWVIRVAGNVKRRPAEMANPKLGTGEIEVEVSELEVLSEARTPPFELNERSAAGEDVRLKYRFLDLRRAEMQRNLRIRHNAIQAVRAFLHEKGFWDVETPLLGKSTPEGARDYLVPSRVNPGTFYALPQSPQLYKQLLMVAGFDKYCQIPRCLRDEDLRADRQPEFTQLDLEMSFVGQEDVFRVIEGAMKALFQGGLGLDIPTPFPRITHAEAMSKYGSDKPDLRFKEELVDLTEFSKTCGFKVFQEAAAKGGLVKGFNAKGWGAKKGRAEIDRLGERVKDFRAKGLAWFRVENGDLNSNLTKFFSPEQRAELKTLFAAADGDLLLFAAGEPGIVNPTLSFLRNLWGAEEGRLVRHDPVHAEDFNFLWVTDFPLLSWSVEDRKWCAEHHPFTIPSEESLPVIMEAAQKPAEYNRPDSALRNCKAVCYDLVLNGSEIASGSVRIHRSDIQQAVFQLLDLSQEDIKRKFGFFIEALQYGTPPHAGVAWGMDRIMTMMTGSESIREVIAFPKNQRGADLMSGAPSDVDLKQLEELSLRTVAVQPKEK